MNPYEVARIPRLVFGPGRLGELPDLVAPFGRRILVVTGSGSLDRSGTFHRMKEALEAAGARVHRASVAGEPSPEFVDETAGRFRGAVDAVVAVGGGSALDAGKAIAAMLTRDGSVADYLEGVGTLRHDGVRLPLVAVPTTAGTGSEATKNAVLSRVGSGGFKRSLRAEGLVPDVALLDPELTVGCPGPVTAACGLDAFTQLLEALTSPACGPFIEVLALDGIERLGRVLERVVGMAEGVIPEDGEARGEALYASYLSGIALASAGLGIVHGLASPLGGRFRIPHGVACGTLLAPATAANVRALRRTSAGATVALGRYAEAGRRALGQSDLPENAAIDSLLALLESWSDRFGLPRLAVFGIGPDDLPALSLAAGQKTNAVRLEQVEVSGILQARI